MKYNHRNGLPTPQIIASCGDGMLKSAVKNSAYSLTSTQQNPTVAIAAVLDRAVFLLAVTCERKGQQCLSLNHSCGSQSVCLTSRLITHLQHRAIKKGKNFCATPDIHFPFAPVERLWFTHEICASATALLKASPPMISALQLILGPFSSG